MGRKFGGGLGPLFGEAERVPHLTQSRLGRGLPPSQVASCSMQPFGRKRYGPKWGAVPLWGRAAGSPSNAM